MFKILRVFVLLVILAGVALGTWREQVRSVKWQTALPVNIYLLNGDGSTATADYLRSLGTEDFKPIENFMRDEAARYGRTGKASVAVRLLGKIDDQPPVPPRTGNFLQVIDWSLHMRWWAYRHTDTKWGGVRVNMFLLYHDPLRKHRLEHSTGLQKGLVGIVNVFASRDMAMQNNVVIAHEFLHTLGATDKYDPATNQPLYPDGYAVPDQSPLLPQQYAEIMAGRTPLTRTTAETPASLDLTLIGSQTAREINWL